jgi:hypothetical protein
MIKWKFGLPKRKYRYSDVVVISISKSGRTWLRVFINKYLSLKYGVPFGLGDLSKHDSRVPSVVYTHEIWSHRTDTTLSEFVKGTFILPDRLLFRKKILLLFRNPRDLIVSLYFEATKRSRRTRDNLDCSLSEFIRHGKFGITNIVKVMNHWRKRFMGHPKIKWLSYESMKANSRGEFIDVLKFIGIENVDDELVKEAMEYSSFDNMKKMEKNGNFNKNLLKPTDPSDSNTYKVREGKVGSYINYFGEEDLRYLDGEINKLDGFFGYQDA